MLGANFSLKRDLAGFLDFPNALVLTPFLGIFGETTILGSIFEELFSISILCVCLSFFAMRVFVAIGEGETYFCGPDRVAHIFA